MVNGTQNWPNCVSSRDSGFWSIWSYGFIWYVLVHGLCDQYLVGYRKFAFLAGMRLPRWLLIAAAQMISLWNCDAVTFSCGPTLTSQVQSWIALVALSISSPCFLTSANATFVLRSHVALVGFALWVLTKFGGPGQHQSHPKRTVRSNSFLAFSCGESEASHFSWSTIILWIYYCMYMLIYQYIYIYTHIVEAWLSPSSIIPIDPGWPGMTRAWFSLKPRLQGRHCCSAVRFSKSWHFKHSLPSPGLPREWMKVNSESLQTWIFSYWLYTRVGTNVWISLLKIAMNLYDLF